jgi:hypothetical protein
MKRKNKSKLIYPFFNDDKIDVFINNPLEPVFQDLDTKQFLNDLKTFYNVKKTLTLFNRIKNDILSRPHILQKLCKLTQLSNKEFITFLVELFSDKIDEALIIKLHETVLHDIESIKSMH